LQPKLIAPGGTGPDWGPIDLPTVGGGGGSSGGSGAGTGDGTNPRGGAPERVAPLVGAVSAAGTFRQRKGFRFTVTLARPAKVLVKIEALRLSSRSQKPRTLGTVTLSGKAGENRFAVRRVKGKTLRPGRYRATITAFEGSTRSTPKRLSFRIRP
jgi:hypothetical protein